MATGEQDRERHRRYIVREGLVSCMNDTAWWTCAMIESPVRLQMRALVLMGTFLVGGLVGVSIGSALVSMREVLPFVLLWFAVFGVLQFFLLRCPSCGKPSFVSPKGWSALPGTSCRYCRKPY